MASRLSPPRLPPIDLAGLRPDFRGSVRALAERWPDSRPAWKLALWQAFFFPFWVWSDLPRPLLPERNVALPEGGLAGEQVKQRFRSIARRTWIQRTITILARTLWLTILIAVIWQAIEILGGPVVRFSFIPVAGMLLLIPAFVLIVTSRPSNPQIARMLDRSFHLQERMVTALINIGHDIPLPGERAGLRYLQVADAANALTAIRGSAAFRVMPPVRELVLSIIGALFLASLFFLRGGGGDVPPLQPVIVPEFIPAAQRYVAAPQPDLPTSPLSESLLTQEQIQELAEQSSAIRQDLMTLAGALEDHALTRSAAGAIAQGDYDRAVQELRQAADQVDGLSQSERESLSSDLETAASSMSDGGQGLSEATQNAAEGLREGGTEAEDGMQEVADAVEDSASALASNDALSESLDQPQDSQPADGGAVPEQSQPNGEQQSLFNNQSAGQESAPNSGNEQSQSTEESSSQQAEGPPGSSGDGGEGSNQEAEQGPGEPGEGSGDPGGGAQAPSEDVTGGGETPFDDPALMERPPVSGAGQQASTADGSSADSSGEDGPDGATSGTESDDQLPDPSEPEVSDSEIEGEGAEGDEVAPGGSVMLERAPQGQAVPVQGAGSQSNLGSGSGVAAGSGGSTQGDVATSGPDSNHVPAEYRAIVESYFSPIEE